MAQLPAEKTVYICLDNDEAGKKRSNADQADPDRYRDRGELLVCFWTAIKTSASFLTKNKKPTMMFNNLIKQAFSIQEWWKINKPEDFATITAAELRKMEFPADQWLIDRIIPREGFCFIFGAEGTGKSFYRPSYLAQATSSPPARIGWDSSSILAS